MSADFMNQKQEAPSRLFEIPDYQRTQYPKGDAFAFKSNGSWQYISIDSFIDKVNTLSHGLLALGISKGDRVVMVSHNRPEWLLMDYALQQIGAISVPLYPTITIADYQYIIKDSGAKMAVAGDRNLFEKVKTAVANIPEVAHIFTFDRVENADHWEHLLELGVDKAHHHLTAIQEEITPEDIVTIIYTSGTTGHPKGVMLTHNNILSNALAVAKIFPAKGHELRTLSFLPLCHIFERTASFMAVYLGVSIYFAESMDTIGENLKEVKPHYFSAVPRLLEKTYEKIMDKGMKLTGVTRKIFNWAVDLSRKYQLPLTHGWWYRQQLIIANKLVFSKWREAMGGEIQFIVSGSAALNSSIGRAFWAANIPVLEAYGLTETSPGVCFTRLDYQQARIGSVGSPLEGVEVKIGDDGEILVKGPNVMKGYYNRPDLTLEVISADGWFHTGDIGVLSGDNVLTITDRKKEMFKTSGGKYIAPQIMENFFKESPFIDQIMVVGEGRKYPAALIIPADERLKEWAETQGINAVNFQELLQDQKTVALFRGIVDDRNLEFAQFEKIKNFKLIADSWSVESGELTPTLKLKRRMILSKYQADIQSFYE